MRDSSHQGGTPANSPPPDQFAGRLLQRAGGHGVGVIDVGWAQRRFAYTTDWTAKRFAMLGLLNARYGTIDNQTAATSTALPIVHGSIARKHFSTLSDEASPHAASNESSPLTTGHDESPRTSDDRTLTPGHESRAAEIPAPSPKMGDTLVMPVVQRKSATPPKMGDTLVMPVVQRKSATPFPDTALPRAESQHTAPQKSQLPSAHESAPRVGLERPSSYETPSAMATEEGAHQPSASNAATDGANTKQGVEVQETVTRPQATHEPILHVDARVESPPTVAASDSTVAGGSSELNPPPLSPVETNHLPPSPEQQRTQPSQTASPLPLREIAPVVSHVARKASDSSTRQDETFDRDESESESPLSALSSAGDTQGVQSRTNSALPVAVEQAATEHQPQHDHRTFHAEVAPRTAAEIVPPASQAGDVPARSRVSAPEVLQRPSHLFGARMIWRKGFGATSLAADDARHAGQPDMPLSHSVQNVSSLQTLYRAEAAASHISREASAGYVSRSMSGDNGNFAPAAPAQSESVEVDLEQITEHVSRVILRRVSVERERRGSGKWL